MCIAVSATLTYELARTYYRPYIYSHSIFDFHIADTLGNSLGTIALIFTTVSILGRDQGKAIFFIRTMTIANVIYEIAHPLLGKNIDILDAATTLIFGAFSEILFRWLSSRKALQSNSAAA
jgi:hypothetical protein